MSARGDVQPALRLPLLILGFASLAIGVGAGLTRLGWHFPLPSPGTIMLHGPLMVCGFFGTVISLERAVALARRSAYLGPLFTGLGGAAAIAGMPGILVPALITLGSLVLFAGSLSVFLRQRALFTFSLAVGAACWTVGNVLWLIGFSLPSILPWWLGFLILTIAGERLELSRFLRPSRLAARLFAVVLALLLGAMVASAAWPQAGTAAFGAVLLALTAWLLRQDIARRTIKTPGLTRFVAVSLLSGYVWLAAGGLILLGSGGLVPGTAGYDAALHALLLGFVFSMVFGHAPIIFPAVLRVAVPYHASFYLPLALLHVSLLLRAGAGLMGWFEGRSLGGMLNALALLAFVVSTATAVIRGRMAARAVSAPAKGA